MRPPTRGAARGAASRCGSASGPAAPTRGFSPRASGSLEQEGETPAEPFTVVAAPIACAGIPHRECLLPLLIPRDFSSIRDPFLVPLPIPLHADEFEIQRRRAAAPRRIDRLRPANGATRCSKCRAPTSSARTYAASAWTGPPAEAFGWWKSRVPEPHAKKISSRRTKCCSNCSTNLPSSRTMRRHALRAGAAAGATTRAATRWPGVARRCRETFRRSPTYKR